MNQRCARMRSRSRALAISTLIISIACAGSSAAQGNRRSQSAPEQAPPAASDAPQESAGTVLEGSVLLEFTIAADGTTKDIVVVESSPPGVLDQAAVEALAKWRYKPKIENGQPVERRVETRIVFKLEE